MIVLFFVFGFFWYDDGVKQELSKASAEYRGLPVHRRTVDTTPPQQSTRTVRRVISLSLFLAILVGVWYVMQQPYFMIEQVMVSGERTIPNTELVAAVDSYLDATWLGLVPRRNFLVVGPSRLQTYLEKNYPKIYSSTIDIDHHSMHLVVEERLIHSLWCTLQEYENPFDEECYFADQRGTWYIRSPYFSDNVFRKVYVDPAVDTIQPDEHFMEEQEFQNFFIFLSELERDYSFDIGAVYLLPQGDVVLGIERFGEVRYKTKPRIIFNQEDSFERISRDIGITIKEPDFQSSFQSNPEELQTIDVRFKGRIFYRFGVDPLYTHYRPLGGDTSFPILEDFEGKDIHADTSTDNSLERQPEDKYERAE